MNRAQKITPYDWQQESIENSINCILRSENGAVYQPTSTGKSTEAAFIAMKCITAHKMKGLYLYNENEGLDQAREKFQAIFTSYGHNIVCANFFGGSKEDPDHADIVFASYQSLNNHHEKWYKYFDQNHFQFIIVNEAHYGQAVTYKEVINYFNCSKIGMTATPDREDGKDILEIFHKVIYELPFEDAMIRGYISPVQYRVFSSNLSKKKLKEMFHDVIEEGKAVSMKQLNETLFIDSYDDEVLSEIYTNSVSKQTLIYCENVLHANRTYENMKADNKSVAVIHSKKNRNHNQRMMKLFRQNEIQYLISVNKLNEDIDVPNVEVGVFLRCTDSKRIFYQQLGRILRKKPGKLALIMDFVANAERIVMLHDINRSILNRKIELGLGLQKTPLTVSGENFDISFSVEELEVVKIFKAIEERLGMRGVWPSEEELRENVIAHFGHNKFFGKEYDKVKNLFKGPGSTDFRLYYSKSFNEVFGRKKREINQVWSTEEELRESVIKHFGHNKFTGKEYDEVRRLFKGPSSFVFSLYYSKSFNEVFGREKFELNKTWSTEEELRESVIKHFGHNKFTEKEYSKVRHKFNGPSRREFQRIYSKSFCEVFDKKRTKRKEKEKPVPNEEVLRSSVIKHFGHNKFTEKEYDEIRLIFNGVVPGSFQRFYSKSFNEVFGRKKGDNKLKKK